MDRQEEYHDPDYPEAPSVVNIDSVEVSEEEKIEKAKRIICREFTNELHAREEDIALADQRSLTARRLLHLLRCVLVNNYYNDQRLLLTGTQIEDDPAVQVDQHVKNELRSGQRRLHPSVRKLLGDTKPVDLQDILHPRAPRVNSRKDYSAMVKTRNYTIAADKTKSLRPSPDPIEEITPETSVKKVPRRIQPKLANVVTLDEATRNQSKHRYRIIIGNTSKYAPGASSCDRSTHKWLLYVRLAASTVSGGNIGGDGGNNGGNSGGGVIRAVTVTLHHSYAPHHTVHIDKPPFHVSRRGWGEFPARVELHFHLPLRNRPAQVEHTIRLDKNCTGLQTLGAETVVDVWLYSTKEMLQYEFKEDDIEMKMEPEEQVETKIKEELTETSIVEANDKQTDSWLDFFTNTREMDVDEMIIKPEKKNDEQINNSDNDNLNEENCVNVNDVNNSDLGDLQDGLDAIMQNDKSDLFNNVTVKKEIEMEDFPDQLLSQPTSPRKRIMKYLDPTTGKIYYLEMDRNLDLTKVQEIVINSKGNVKTAKISPLKANGLKKVRKTKKGVSLLKPEIKSLLKSENKPNQQTYVHDFSHIENDHCYLGSVKKQFEIPSDLINDFEVKEKVCVYKCLCEAMHRLNSVKSAVAFCLKRMPVISDEVKDAEYQKYFPYVVESSEKYWKLDFAKRRNIEWSRAKLINRILNDNLNTTETIWRTKQILIYSRLHGYQPMRTESHQRPSLNDTDWSSWLHVDNSSKLESDIKSIYPNISDISSLTKFDANIFSQSLSESLEQSDSDDDIEIVKWEEPVRIKMELQDDRVDLPSLPVLDDKERLSYLYIERKCADIGIELRNEDVGSGYSYSAVHAVLLSAVKSMSEEILRGALASKLTRLNDGESGANTWIGSSSRTEVGLADVWCAVGGRGVGGRLSILSGRGRGRPKHEHTVEHL